MNSKQQTSQSTPAEAPSARLIALVTEKQQTQKELNDLNNQIQQLEDKLQRG